MSSYETMIGAFAFTAIYFFVAGLVAEHSCSNKYMDISSPLPSLLRGLAWPLVAFKYLVLMLWGGL